MFSRTFVRDIYITGAEKLTNHVIFLLSSLSLYFWFSLTQNFTRDLSISNICIYIKKIIGGGGGGGVGGGGDGGYRMMKIKKKKKKNLSISNRCVCSKKKKKKKNYWWWQWY